MGLATLRWIWNHPLARRNRPAAFARFLRWQFGSRLVGGAVAHPFVGTSRLLVTPGLTGATGNVYAGLHEFVDMGFVLHALRPGDLFVDVGANVGSYTVLAATTGAHVVAFEPVAATFARLAENVRLNGFDARVRLHNAGVGRMASTLRFSDDLDTMNHVLPPDAPAGTGVRVASHALDGVLDGARPLVVKIDVEGWEAEVLAGATGLLGGDDPRAFLVELNGSDGRYGYAGTATHDGLLARGFIPVAYDPLTRTLQPLQTGEPTHENGLYIRDLPFFQERTRTAPTYDVQGTPV